MLLRAMGWPAQLQWRRFQSTVRWGMRRGLRVNWYWLDRRGFADETSELFQTCCRVISEALEMELDCTSLLGLHVPDVDLKGVTNSRSAFHGGSGRLPQHCPSAAPREKVGWGSCGGSFLGQFFCGAVYSLDPFLNGKDSLYVRITRLGS